MGILQNIADGKPIEEPIEAELVEPFSDLLEKVQQQILTNQENMVNTQIMQARTLDRISYCDSEIARLEAEIAARKARTPAPEPQKSPPKAPENVPPVLRPTAPLGYLMNERTQKNAMEQGTWDMHITIDTLTIDELVKPSDFANNVAHQNHRANILRNTPPDTFPGFRIRVKVGLASSGKRIIRPSISKEDVMNSKEFLLAFKDILDVIKSNSGLPG